MTSKLLAVKHFDARSADQYYKWSVNWIVNDCSLMELSRLGLSSWEIVILCLTYRTALVNCQCNYYISSVSLCHRCHLFPLLVLLPVMLSKYNRSLYVQEAIRFSSSNEPISQSVNRYFCSVGKMQRIYNWNTPAAHISTMNKICSLLFLIQTWEEASRCSSWGPPNVRTEEPTVDEVIRAINKLNNARHGSNSIPPKCWNVL